MSLLLLYCTPTGLLSMLRLDRKQPTHLHSQRWFKHIHVCLPNSIRITRAFLPKNGPTDTPDPIDFQKFTQNRRIMVQLAPIRPTKKIDSTIYFSYTKKWTLWCTETMKNISVALLLWIFQYVQKKKFGVRLHELNCDVIDCFLFCSTFYNLGIIYFAVIKCKKNWWYLFCIYRTILFFFSYFILKWSVGLKMSSEASRCEVLSSSSRS